MILFALIIADLKTSLVVTMKIEIVGIIIKGSCPACYAFGTWFCEV